MTQDIVADVAQVMAIARSSGLFISLCTISAPQSGGRVPSGTYTPVTGLSNLPCMDAPAGMSTGIAANEITSLTSISSIGRRHVLLDRYYAELGDSSNWGNIGWIATVDGVVYDILGAECDSQRQMTRLSLEKVSV